MTDSIEKPCKQLVKALLKDAEECEGIMAVTFLKNGEVRAHGAGVIITNPELALYGTARLVFALLGKGLPEEHLNGSLTISYDENRNIHIIGEGGVNQDPRASIHLLGSTLLEFSRLVAQYENITQDIPKL